MNPLHSFEHRNGRKFTRTAEPQALTPSLLCAGALLLGVAVAIAQTSPTSSDLTVAGTRGRPVPREDRLREGTELIDQQGAFRMTGDRVTFFTDSGSGRFIVLENLALQRVARTIEDSPVPLDWTVSGVITEFHGDNFLLVRRVVLRNRRHD